MNSKKSFLSIVRRLSLIIFLSGTFEHMFLLSGQKSNVKMDTHLYIAMGCLFAFVLLFLRAKILYVVTYFAAAIWCVVSLWQIYPWYIERAKDICILIFLRNTMLFFFYLIIQDYVIKRRFLLLKRKEIVVCAIAVLGLILLVIINGFGKTIFPFILVSIAVLTFDICDENREEIVRISWISSAIIWLNIIVGIFYGQKELSNRMAGRYEAMGTPVLSKVGCLFMTITVAIFIVDFLKKRIYWIIFEIASFVASLFTISVVGARAGLLASAFLICFSYFYILNKTGKYTLIRISTIVAIGLFFVLCVLMVSISFVPKEYFLNMPESFLRSKLEYWNERVGLLFVDNKSKLGNITSKGLVNRLDWFSSGRLSIWKAYLTKVNLWGNDDLGTIICDYYSFHPHNTFYAWVIYFGIIPSLFFFIWFIRYLLISVKTVKRGKTEAILPMVWAFVFLIFSSVDTCLWNEICGFYLLIFGILIKKDNCVSLIE